MRNTIKSIVAAAIAVTAMSMPAMAQGHSHGNNGSRGNSGDQQKTAVVHHSMSTNRGTHVLCEDGTWVYGADNCGSRGGLASRQGDYGTTPRASERAREVANEHSAVARSTYSRTYSNRRRSGAIARCNDGTYWHATTRRNACVNHGGVARWY